MSIDDLVAIVLKADRLAEHWQQHTRPEGRRWVMLTGLL